MKIFFDTEFIEDGKTIDLISIGLVREDGEELYLESADCDLSRASDWVKEHVIPQLSGERVSRAVMASAILKFAGAFPEFWAYYASYDWVVLCQLFGRMIDLPRNWPMFCRDLKQLAGETRLPKQAEGLHNALADAKWNRDTYLWLTGTGPGLGVGHGK